jgi:predicted enzyme related to lactoylglutathione lyase
MQKVTGIGGVFIKAKEPKVLAAWYQEHLGIGFDGNTYVAFDWTNDSANPGSTVFSFFKESSDYFKPSEKNAMLNFRVHDLDALLAALKEKNVWVDEKTESYEYGKFGWTMDPEGNKIELWQPA